MQWENKGAKRVQHQKKARNILVKCREGNQKEKETKDPFCYLCAIVHKLETKPLYRKTSIHIWHLLIHTSSKDLLKSQV